MMKTVLLVENDDFILNFLEKEIDVELNVRVLKTSSFKEAIKYILEEEIIHVAIIDFNLLGAQNGQVIRYAIKQNIPSIILSDDCNGKLKDIILEKNILDYIIKDTPSSIENIVKLINRTLKNYDTNIMLVDDSSVQLNYALKKLQDMKLNVTTANNGKEALDIIQKGDKKYSLLLTDYYMPIMDGMELTLKLRDIYKKDRFGIVVLSSSEEPEIASAFIKAGANDFINKPYSDVEFTIRVNSNLELLDTFEKTRLKDQYLFRAEKMASMGEMIGNIAHQWRQPLSAISTVVSGLQLQKNVGVEIDDKELNQVFNTILERTQFLTQTIEDFRDFTKEDKEFEKIDINNIINRTISIQNKNLISLNINISTNLEKNCFVIGMQGEISQVILNILNNARDVLKYKEQDNKTIEISSYNKEDRVIIKIRDNAGGIPSDVLPKIFDPYFTTKHQSQGKGMGLYISKEIIEKKHNGRLSVINDDNCAIFTIELLDK